MRTQSYCILLFGLIASVAGCTVHDPNVELSNARATEVRATPVAPSHPSPEPTADTRPAGFANVDFSNLRYPFGELKNGQYSLDPPGTLGGTTYSLDSVYFADLTGDSAPEAIVFVNRVVCGGSCDGGSSQIFFFRPGAAMPIRLGVIETGSRAYGCALKSFSIAEKTIRLVQFGECTKQTDVPENEQTGKFQIQNETESFYTFEGSRLRRKSIKVIETPEQSALNYQADIKVDQIGD